MMCLFIIYELFINDRVITSIYRPIVVYVFALGKKLNNPHHRGRELIERILYAGVDQKLVIFVTGTHTGYILLLLLLLQMRAFFSTVYALVQQSPSFEGEKTHTQRRRQVQE